MPEVASSGSGAPEVQMLFSCPTTPEPAWHRPIRLPMSPTPGTLPIPASGADRVVNAVSGDVGARSVVAAGLVFAVDPVVAAGPVCAAGAAAGAGAAVVPG